MSKDKIIYKDKTKPVEERVRDLIKRMTIEEKILQMCAVNVLDVNNNPLLKNKKFSIKKAKKILGKGMGQISCILRHFSPSEGAKLANEIQAFALKQTRLGIPIIIHDEALHGCVAKGSTSFPQAIALASTFDDELVEKIAHAIGKESSSRGINQVLSPTINIGRDPRCGRTEETYGEDPYLTSRMAVAFVKGIQSEKVIATVKHFAANFCGDGGRDSAEIHLSERILREIFFPAFESAIKEADALSVMAAYNSIDGVPCSANKWLLKKILREEWGFKGIVVSDYWSVPGLYLKHKTAQNQAEATLKAVEAGLDVELPGFDCYYNELLNLVKKEKISVELIDQSVKRILYVKFRLGLFDNPFVDPQYAEKICNCTEHKNLSLEAARKSIVLLKNKNNILPLKKNLSSIAVIGPNSNVPRLGGYSNYNTKVVTPLEGIKNMVSKSTEVYFAEGCPLKENSKKGFAEAIDIAKKSDVILLFMGNNSGWGPDEVFTEGEDHDRCNLNLPGAQEDLILELANLGKPIIVTLINGAPVTMTNWIDKVDGLIEAWYPGQEGGTAIAEIIFGICNPSGKLPITFPKTTGQLPLYYNYKPSGRKDDYIDLRGQQYLFPFGFGLSYTKFEYKNLKIQPKTISPKGKVKVTVEIKNVGKYPGEEVVQLYIRDDYSSLSRPVKELKAFKRIHLKPNEKKRVEFVLGEKELQFLNACMEYTVEPGTFTVMVGGDSENVISKKFKVV